MGAAPDFEAELIVLTRALHALDALATEGTSTMIVMVTQDAVIRPVLVSIQPGIRPLVGTASRAEVTHIGGGWIILSVDNTAR